MSTVLRTTEALSPTEARALTNRIRESAEQLNSLLLEAYEREAWRALGYGSWREYAMEELSISQSRAYQLLDHARVAAALHEAAGGFSTDVEITEAAARDIKPVLELVTDDVRARVAQGEAPGEAVRAAVEERRDAKRPSPAPPATHRPSASPVDASDGPERAPDDDPGRAPDLVAELESADREIRRLEALVDSLQKDDLARELRAQSAKYAQLEARLQQQITTGNEAKQQATRQGRVLKEVRRLLEVERDGEIVAALQDLLR